MNNPSLLPYLNGTGRGFSLEFQDCREEPGDNRGPRFPFELMSEASGLTRIMGARIVSDGGGEVRRVFLLMSRDEYSLQDGGMGAPNNADIDEAWKRKFQAHRASADLIPLAGQMDEAGSLVAFSPLFVCTHTRRFFHPPCPQCGGELDLVRDDNVLAGFGLKPYSKSLRRYTACPACMGKPGAALYASRPDEADPVIVKGPVEIVSGLTGLDVETVPCTGCDQRRSCHGSRHLSDRVLPVAFYPFHVFMFEAASINASDFMALISGAGFSDLEAGLDTAREFTRRAFVGRLRDGCRDPLLFRGDERRFAETLYLKLSFLLEVAGHVLDNPDKFSYPGFGPSLERLWVLIPEQSGYLPSFWSFRLALMDMDPRVPAVLPAPGADHAVHALGLLWFHALLMSRALDVRAVNEGIGHLLKERRDGLGNPVFSPENIFWEQAPVAARWVPFWKKALNIGASLLLREGTGGFCDACRELLGELKSELFSSAPVPVPREEIPRAEAAGDLDGERIGSAIRSIRQRWAEAAAPKEKEPTRRVQEQELDTTVVLSPEHSVNAPGGQEDHDKTVVMPAQPVREAAPGAGDDDFSTETVIMQREPVPEKRQAQAPADDELSETVVMGPGTKAAPQSPKQEPGKPDDDLAETVIIKPEKK